MEKLNIGNYCNPNSCEVRYKVVIHQSRKSKYLADDLKTKPMVYIGLREGKKVMITKSNLKLISSNEDPCTADDTLIGLDCRNDKVCILECKTSCNDYKKAPRW